MIIISDLGGVVLEKGFWKLWDFIKSEHGVDTSKSKDVFLTYYKDAFSGKISYAEFLNNLERDLHLSMGYDYWNEKLLDFFTPQKEVIEVYKEIKTEGHVLVLLSDQITELWQEIDKRHNISELFDYVIISSETSFTKPDIRIYKYALDKCNGRAENSIFIDDREENLVPAKKLGMDVLLYEGGNLFRESLNSKIK